MHQLDSRTIRDQARSNLTKVKTSFNHRGHGMEALDSWPPAIDFGLIVAGYALAASLKLPLIGLVVTVMLTAMLGQTIYRLFTPNLSWAIIFGPVTAAFAPAINRAWAEKAFSHHACYTSGKEAELFRLSRDIVQSPNQLSEKHLMYWMLASDQEIRDSENEVRSAIEKTQDAVRKLTPLTSQSSTIGSLIKELKVQEKKLNVRLGELAETRETLEQEITGTKQRFDTLNQARLALDSLKLFDSNKRLLEATEAALSRTKDLCLEWKGRLEMVALDTRTMLSSLPEASEVYQVTA